MLNFGIRTGLLNDESSTAYYSIVAAVEIVAFIVYLLLIKHYYGEDWKKSIWMGDCYSGSLTRGRCTDSWFFDLYDHGHDYRDI